MVQHADIDHTGLTGVGGIDSGTSFPGGPSTNDLFYRTDRDLLYFYDGSQWLTVQLYRESVGQGSSAQPIASGSGSVGRMTPWHTTYDLWLEAFYSSTYVTATNNGSNYWTVTLQKANAADAKTSIVSFNTSADTQGNWTTRNTSIGALLVPATYKEIDVQATETGTVGDLYWAFGVAYRLVG